MVSGNGAFDSLSDMDAGSRVTLKFNGVVTISNRSSSPILRLQHFEPLITKSGDVVEFLAFGSGEWREINR